jgi:hypothetical protein
MLYHTRTANNSPVARDTVWQVFRRPSQPVSTRAQCNLTAPYRRRLLERGTATQRLLLDDSGCEGGKGWDAHAFETLGEAEQRCARAAESGAVQAAGVRAAAAL